MRKTIWGAAECGQNTEISLYDNKLLNFVKNTKWVNTQFGLFFVLQEEENGQWQIFLSANFVKWA
jgi:hypothetical protein